MNIGFVSTWLHRGGTYVTINYAKMLMPEHNIFVYARAGEYFDCSFVVDGIRVYEGERTKIVDGLNTKELIRWLKDNYIDILIWNEQRDLSFVCNVKKEIKNIIQGAYIDYYKESTIHDFAVFDFLLCNTKRHYSVFNWHPHCFYLPWGCDIDLYKPKDHRENDGVITFFHSMGMSDRKGTDVLINTFVDNNLAKMGAKLVVHTQVNIDHIIDLKKAQMFNIDIVENTVPAPGLYYMGDVYVYPAKLDGLGLTMYEAIACGMPVIATDIAPMNEVITSQCGFCVAIKRQYARDDGYYWPQADVDENSLLEGLLYYINKKDDIAMLSEQARKYAVENWNLSDRKSDMLEIVNIATRNDDMDVVEKYLQKYNKQKKITTRKALTNLLMPNIVYSKFKKSQLKRRAMRAK